MLYNHIPDPRTPPWLIGAGADQAGQRAGCQLHGLPARHIHLDWLSLHACRLLDANGRYLRYSLGEIVESLSDWRKEDDAVMREFAPGEINREVASALSLKSVLTATAQQFPGGIAVNAAYDLLKKVLGGWTGPSRSWSHSAPPITQ
jgi:hypothetical protein